MYDRLKKEEERVRNGHSVHIHNAIFDTETLSDEIDIAQRYTDQAVSIRHADKEDKLLKEIIHALGKMSAGTYGICEGTEETIGFKRLEARPWTRYSVEYKEIIERSKKQGA